MAMRLGTENKRQVYILVGLFVVIVATASYEIFGPFGGSPKSAQPAAVAQPATVQTAPASGNPAAFAGPAAQKISSTSINPVIHFEKLDLSERVEYRGTGRNIFFAGPKPVKVEAPVKSVRLDKIKLAALALPVIPEKPRPPAIDLKYFGYILDKDKSIKAFFVRGEDIFVAHSGDIVNHRYKVGSIMPGSVQVTDLSYDNTQTLSLILH
jgi:hypothetical protein